MVDDINDFFESRKVRGADRIIFSLSVIQMREICERKEYYHFILNGKKKYFVLRDGLPYPVNRDFVKENLCGYIEALIKKNESTDEEKHAFGNAYLQDGVKIDFYRMGIICRYYELNDAQIEHLESRLLKR